MGNVCAVRLVSEKIVGTFEDMRKVKPHEPVTFMDREGSVSDSNTISVETPKVYHVQNEIGLFEIFHKCRHCGNLYAEE